MKVQIGSGGSVIIIKVIALAILNVYSDCICLICTKCWARKCHKYYLKWFPKAVVKLNKAVQCDVGDK